MNKELKLDRKISWLNESNHLLKEIKEFFISETIKQIVYSFAFIFQHLISFLLIILVIKINAHNSFSS